MATTLAKLQAELDAGVRLVAVSKRQPIAKIEAAYQAGQRCFAENQLQEALPKITALQAYQDIEWHFIGHLQSNKSKLVAENFAWLQSLDSEKLALRLNKQRPENLPPLNVCLQVNIADETNKSGILAQDALTLAEQIAPLSRLTLRGLMVIPLKTDEVATQRHYFQQTHQLFAELKAAGFELDTLSMGMSHDYQVAIAEGSTMVRIGTGIFGPRDS